MKKMIAWLCVGYIAAAVLGCGVKQETAPVNIQVVVSKAERIAWCKGAIAALPPKTSKQLVEKMAALEKPTNEHQDGQAWRKLEQWILEDINRLYGPPNKATILEQE